MGMVVMPGTLTVGAIGQALDEDGAPTGEGGAVLAKGFGRFADELAWWSEAIRRQRAVKAPPY
jgi:hypothetical protein